MKFKEGDVIKNINDKYIDSGYVATVTKCDGSSVWFMYEGELRYRPMEWYQLANLDDKIQYAKDQLKETEKLISEKETAVMKLKNSIEQLENEKKLITPKVGDKYRLDWVYDQTFDNTIVMITSTIVNGETLYTLTIVECPNSSKHIGTYWTKANRSIKDLLSTDGHRLTKIN